MSGFQLNMPNKPAFNMGGGIGGGVKKPAFNIGKLNDAKKPKFGGLKKPGFQIGGLKKGGL